MSIITLVTIGEIFMGRVKTFFSRRILIYALLLLTQIAYFALFAFYLDDKLPYFNLCIRIMSFFFIVYIMSKPINPEYKIAWIIPILALPLLGVLAYIILKRKRFGARHRNSYDSIMERTKGMLVNNLKELNLCDQSRLISTRLKENSGYPLSKADNVKYFSSGEEYGEQLLIELKKAQNFIFIEYFIICPGVFMQAVFEILTQKVLDGVDVRVMFDDLGCAKTLHRKELKLIRSKGIKIIAFNPFKPFLNIQLNNRSHKKVVIIDGKVAFTGGLNLAYEYVNAIVRFGHWKDAGIMFNGKGVDNFTLAFLQLWSVYQPEDNIEKFLNIAEPVEKGEMILPFVDIPTDAYNVTENTFLQMIYQAKKFIYIFTPYLIIDNELSLALSTAKKSGIDVRIVVPHIPDKKTVFEITKYYYSTLVNEGVKVYEYTPGFIHSKVVFTDDQFAYVGTCNFDYRSIYLHFENGVYIDSKEICQEIKKDFDQTFAVSEEKTVESIKTNIFVKIWRGILRLFAPLM